MPTKLIAVTIAIVVAAAGLLWWATAPSQMAGHSMTPPDTAELALGAPIVDVSLPAELDQKEELGKRAFEAVCAQCHGQNAAGQNGVAPPLVHKIYEPSHHGDEAFYRAVANGVRSHHWDFGNMPPINGLTRADVGTIVAYVRALQSENGIQ